MTVGPTINDVIGNTAIVYVDPLQTRIQQGRVSGISRDGDQSNATFFYYLPEPGAPKGSQAKFRDINQYKIAYIQYLTKNKMLGTFRKLLQDKYGLSSQSTGLDQAFDDALDKLLNATSINNYNYVLSYKGPKGNGPKGPLAHANVFDAFSMLKNNVPSPADAGVGAPKGPTNYKQTSITDKPTAWQEFKKAALDLTGKVPSRADFDAYYNKLVSEQKRFATNTRYTDTSSTTKQNQFDAESFTLNYIVNRIDTSGQLGGQARLAADTVTQAIKNYGLTGMVTTTTRNKLIKGIMNQTLDEKELDNSLRGQAANVHLAFADDIKNNPNLTFMDIVQPYVATYARTLNVADTDVDISKISSLASSPNGKLTLNDFTKQLRKTEEYSRTPEAKNRASELAVSFARAFGVNI